MLNYADKERLEAKVKEATYANMLGRMVLEATPIALRNKLLGEMSIREDEFVVSAGAIISEIIPYDEFITRVEALKNRIEEDEEPADLDNPNGEKMTDADATDVLYVCGYIKEGVEMNIEKMYSEVMALPDSITSLNQLDIKNEVPEAIKNILSKDKITNFTADVMRAITTDIKNDIAIKEADQQAETDMVTKVSEIEGDGDLDNEAIPPESGDINTPDTPANTNDNPAPENGGALDVPSSDISIDDDMMPIDISEDGDTSTGEGSVSDDSIEGDASEGSTEGDTETPPTDENVDDDTPIDTSEGEGDENADEVSIDDSVDIEDADAEGTDDIPEGDSSDEEEFTIGNDAGKDDEDLDSMTPIEVDTPEGNSEAESHLDDLDDMHKDMEESASEDKEAEALMQESMIRKRVAYIPALQKLAVTLFKEDLAHTRKVKEGYTLGENDMVTQMQRMFSEAAERMDLKGKTNPLTEGEYKTLLYNKVKNIDAYYDTVKTEYDRLLRLYNGDNKKAEAAMMKNKKDERTILYRLLFDVAVLMLIGFALGFGIPVIMSVVPTWASFTVLTGLNIMHAAVFVTAIVHLLASIGIYATGMNKAKSAFDTAMDAVKYSRDLTDAEKAQVETYAKAEFEKYNKLSATQKAQGIDVTETGFFSRLFNSWGN